MLGLPFFGPMYDQESVIVMHPMTAAGAKRFHNPIMFDGIHFPVRFTDLPAHIEHVEDYVEHRIGSARITKVEPQPSGRRDRLSHR